MNNNPCEFIVLSQSSFIVDHAQPISDDTGFSSTVRPHTKVEVVSQSLSPLQIKKIKHMNIKSNR